MADQDHEVELPLKGFSFRFSAKKARDRQLAEWVAADTDRGEVNISEVIKDLLYGWYLTRWDMRSLPLPMIAGQLPTGDGQPPMPERENPDDELVQAMVGFEFNG